MTTPPPILISAEALRKAVELACGEWLGDSFDSTKIEDQVLAEFNWPTTGTDQPGSPLATTIRNILKRPMPQIAGPDLNDVIQWLDLLSQAADELDRTAR